jgi:hypothetical protein
MYSFCPSGVVKETADALRAPRTEMDSRVVHNFLLQVRNQQKALYQHNTRFDTFSTVHSLATQYTR